MERGGADSLTNKSQDLVLSWKKFKLKPAYQHPFDSDTSSSNYELMMLLKKTLSPANISIISQNEALKDNFFDFTNKIYQSDDSYYLVSVLQTVFENAKQKTRDFALETFNKVFSFMGFSGSETKILLEKWSDGMKEGNGNPFDVALNGIEHHMMSIVEVERHKKGGFHELFMDFGLTNAQRYYGAILKYQLESLKQKRLPYIQGIMASGDHSSSMLNKSLLSNFVFDLNRMNHINRGLTVPFRAIEVGSHQEVLKRKQMLKQKYGAGKVLGYYVFGHSDEKRIGLGKYADKLNEELSIKDIINLDLFGKNWGEHVSSPVIILDACSTGKEIARDISAYLNARVYAPMVPSSVERIVVSNDTKPQITNVIFEDSSVLYDNGKAVNYSWK